MSLVYPPDQHRTNSKTIFFIGSAESSCKINHKQVALNEYGNFCEIFDLSLGENIFEIEIDGKVESRKIVAEVSKLIRPVAYAYSYDAFVDSSSVVSSVIKSIIVEGNKIKIPYGFGGLDPFVSLQDDGGAFLGDRAIMQAVVSFRDKTIDLDCIHYTDASNLIEVDDVALNSFKLKFLCDVVSYKKSYSDGYWVLEFELGDPLKPSLIKSWSDNKVQIVVLDPGHGGDELGALSYKGLAEKTLNLSQSQYIAQALNDIGIKCYLTREDDSELGLQERVDFAQAKSADLFLSIHHNALPDARNPLNERGLSAHYYSAHSKNYARAILSTLLDRLGMERHGLFWQDLYVLRESETMPAVLLELGFMTHPQEAELITTVELQKNIAQSLAHAIMELL